MPFDHFDLIAGFFDRVSNFTEAERMFRMAALPVAGRLLDAGGGTGRVAETLRGQVTHLVVIDVSFGMLHRAAEKGLQTTCAPAEELPFSKATFDRIIMVDVLHHVGNQGETAAELWRVLRPGGRIVILEPDIHRFLVKLIALFEKMMLMRSHFLSSNQIETLFVATNAEVKVEHDGFNIWLVIEKEL